jgi:hypothetical protein
MTDRSGKHDEDDVIEVADLPSLPDGGLSANMPSWLRHAPSFIPPFAETPDALDPHALTAGLRLPEWLSELSTRVERGDADAVMAWSAEVTEIDIVIASAEATLSPPLASGNGETESTPVRQAPVSTITVPSVAHELSQPLVMESHYDPPYRRIGFFLILFMLGVIAFTIWSATN